MQINYKHYILSILLSIWMGSAWAQDPKDIWILNKDESASTENNYVARDQIILKADETTSFKFSAPQYGKSFSAKIDAGLLFPSKEGSYLYSDGTTASTPTVVKNFYGTNVTVSGVAVGSIPGQFAVSPKGAATYHIPIEAPVGVNGMQPQLSVLYNSQSGYGILGLGWNVSGLSAITRGNKSIYFDNKNEYIKLDNTDALYIDGQRLIYLSGGTGNLTAGAIYGTEVEDYSRIEYNGSSFILTALDGKILEYGSTNDANLKNANDANDTRVLAWKLKKVTDNYGNSMVYTYTQNGQYISKINYTYNQNSYSGQEIEFVYQVNNFDPKEYFIKTFKINNDKLLQSINLKENGSSLKTYSFSYRIDNHLESVSANVPNGSKIGDTEIEWGGGTVNEISKTTINSTSSIYMGLGGSMTTGDINGDGYPDCIQMLADETGELVIYLFNKTTNSYMSPTNRLLYYCSACNTFKPKLVVCDIDNDGKDEILIYNYNNLHKSLSIFKYNDDFIPYDFYPYTNYQTHLSLMNEFEIPDVTLSEYKFFKANVNNDQYNDVIFAMSDGYFIYYCSGNGINSTNVKKVKFDNSTKIYEGDFDGDKKIDILGITNGGNNQNLGDNELAYTRSNSWDNVLTNKRRIFPVDVNRDGLCDIMFQNKEDKNYTWGIAYNTGGFNSNPQIMNLPDFHASIPSKPNEDDYETAWQYAARRHDIALPIDYNGDGLVDFVIADEVFATPYYKTVCDFSVLGICFSSHEEIAGYYYSYTAWYYYKNVNGKTFELEKQFTDNTAAGTSMTIEDMNGDGISDLAFLQGSGFKAYSKLESNRQKLVSQIKNSNNLGIYNSIHYKNFSDFELYNTSEANSTIRPMREPILVVEEYNNPTDTYGCSYEKPKVHTQGKGFLGFETVKEWNAELGRLETITNYEINSNYCFLNQVSKTIKGGGDIISSITQTNNILSAGGKRYIPIVTNRYISDKSKSVDINEATDYNDHPNSITQTKTIGNLTNTNITTYDYLTDATGKQSLIPCLPKLVTSTSTQNNDTCTRTADYSYNNKGSVIKKVSDKGKDGQIVTEYPETDFDNYGHPLTTKLIAKDANGIDQTRIAKVTYTSSGRFVDSKTNTLGEKAFYEWDENTGRVKSSKDAYGRVTNYTYDAWGQLVDTHYPNNIHKIQFLQWGSPAGSPYNQGSYNVFSQVSGQAPVITYYEPDGDIIQTDSYGLKNKKISVSCSNGFMDENDISRFNKVSEPYFETDPQASDNLCYYDNFQRPKLIETPMGNTEITYSGLTTTSNSTRDGLRETKINTAGQVEYNSINGKKVFYTYYPSGRVHTITPDGKVITMEYNLQGRRTKLIDPHLGTIENKYNGFGELIWEKQKIHLDKPDIITTYNYNPKGVLQSIKRNNEVTTYSYDDHNRVKTIEIVGQNKQTFTYDAYDRVTNVKELIGAREFNTERKFDPLGRVTKEIFPSGYYVENTYDTYSNLIEVKDGMGHIIWKPIEENARGQITEEQKGEERTVDYGFDSNGLPIGIYSDGIVDMEYSFSTKGNLEYRKDWISNQMEQFKYDGLNRLTNYDIYLNGSSTVTKANVIDYNDVGNIENKTDLGNFALSYDGKRVDESEIGPHALATISPNFGTTGLPINISATNLTVKYTDFNKVSTLDEGTKHYELTYGVDDQRRKAVFTNNGQTLTKYYLGDYEEEYTSDENIRKIHYLAGAIYIDNSIKSDSLYYVFTDYQGSVIALTDDNWNVKRKYAYDPWGTRRNPGDWTEKDNGNGLIISRGYTFHEHLDAFDIINMNGRVYDPLTAQFFSADPFINEPDNWLSYNRYAYCKGNPLNRIDPSGYEDIDGGSKGDLDVYADYSYYGYDNLYNSSDSWGNFGDFEFDGHPTDNAGITYITGPNLLSQNSLTPLPTPIVGVNVTAKTIVINGINIAVPPNGSISAVEHNAWQTGLEMLRNVDVSFIPLGEMIYGMANSVFNLATNFLPNGSINLDGSIPFDNERRENIMNAWMLIGTAPMGGVAAEAKAGMKALSQGMVSNAGGKITSFTTQETSTFYRVYSSNPNGGAFLTKVAPKSSAFAREGLALPPSNTASYIQEVIVPRGVTLQRSRALGAFGRRGGLEQFQILNFEPGVQFLPGVPLY